MGEAFHLNIFSAVRKGCENFDKVPDKCNHTVQDDVTKF